MYFAFIGTTEIVIVLVVALLVFGPQKLPEIGRQVGSALRELNRMRSDVQRAFDFEEYTRDHTYSSTRYDSAPYGTTYPTNYNGYDSSHALESAEDAVTAAEREHGIGVYDSAADHDDLPNADASVGATAAAFVPPPGPPVATAPQTAQPLEPTATTVSTAAAAPVANDTAH
jgi:TatA/E family protein of Tat protein translocase